MSDYVKGQEDLIKHIKDGMVDIVNTTTGSAMYESIMEFLMALEPIDDWTLFKTGEGEDESNHLELDRGTYEYLRGRVAEIVEEYEEGGIMLVTDNDPENMNIHAWEFASKKGWEFSLMIGKKTKWKTFTPKN